MRDFVEGATLVLLLLAATALLGVAVGGTFLLADALFGRWSLAAMALFWLPVGTGIACALDRP